MPIHNNRFFGFVDRFWPHIILSIIVIMLFGQNYVPGTWLTGWDNLHPEFNFLPNIIDRSFTSTWQAYQGLGVRAGNAHAADLLRQVVLYILSFAFPASILRYLYHFAALLFGALGAYTLISRKLIKANTYLTKQIAGFAGALFYLLNLGTMQNFYVPYEAFSHFYASLPWLLLGIISLLDRPSKRTYLWFTVISILAIPMNYIPTLFLVYLLVVSTVSAIQVIRTKQIKHILGMFSIIVCVNAYWLFPFISFAAHGTAFVSEVKINRMFTEEAFLRNQKFGTLADVPILRGFLFDTTDMTDTKTGANDFIMIPWINFLRNPAAIGIYYALFVLIVIGFTTSIRNRQPYSKTLTVLFLIALFTLINDNFPTGNIFAFFQQYVPLFKQVLRFPFTKFIVPASLMYAVGIGYFVLFVCQNIKKISIAKIIIPVSIGVLLFINAPSFSGHFIYNQMRQNIPQEYFRLFAFFNTQEPDGKIANLPQPTYWGWTTYDWGYRGSGFPWYGIRQPILDRAFDVWNLSNEQYYTDLTAALYTKQTPAALEHVFDTYGIRYLWLDEHVVLPHKPSALLYPETKKLLGLSKRFTSVFQDGKQSVYRYDSPLSNQRIWVAPSYTPKLYPFSRISDKTQTISNGNNDISITADIPDSELLLPTLGSLSMPLIATATNSGKESSIIPILPILTNNGTVISSTYGTILTYQVPKDSLVQINNALVTQNQPFVLYPEKNTLSVYASTPDIRQNVFSTLFNREIHNCNEANRTAQSVFGIDASTPNQLTLFGQKSRPCVYGQFSALIPKIGAPTSGIIQITAVYKSQTDEYPHLCLTRTGETECTFETKGTEETVTLPNGWKKLSVLVPNRDYPLKDMWLKLELEADGTTQRKLIIQSVELNLFTVPVMTKQFNIADIDGPQIRIPVKRGTLTLTVPKTVSLPTNILPDTIPAARRNCYAIGKGTYDKEILSDTDNTPFIRYSASDASSCDYVPLYNPIIQAGAIATYTTRTISGRPIKTCVKIDPPGYCLFEDMVRQNKTKWTASNFLVPPVSETIPTSWYVELDNYAVGQEKRINDVASIQVVPIPAEYIQSISITSPDMTNVTPDNQATDVTINKSSPTYYSVEIPNAEVKTGSALLVFSQNFDDSWLAMRQSTSFPYLAPAGNHVLVNNWANGWVLNNPINESNTETAIILFFWPQLFEYIGFLLLPLPFLFIWKAKY